MSVKVPKETVEYQSHNHCQCDFCCSRRSLNAKKYTASQRALLLQHAKLRNGCCCNCHNAVDAATFAKDHNHTDFDPNYPVPVNQTALNAARGRNGIPEGNKYTIANGTTKGTPANVPPRTKEEEERYAMEDLDRLERLLIMEHKARVKATLEADKLAGLRSTGAEARPQPLPQGYNFMSVEGSNPNNGGLPGDTARGPRGYLGESAYPGASYEGVPATTIREAYELAHHCPVTPPPQCRASHRLQDTMDDVRVVAMDPVNLTNRGHLQRLLHQNGMISTPSSDGEAGRHSADHKGRKDGPQLEFGNTMAQNRTSSQHPYGAGVLWTKDKRNIEDGRPRTNCQSGNNELCNCGPAKCQCKSSANCCGQDNARKVSSGPSANDSGAASLPPGAAAAMSVQQVPAPKKVTIAA